jgi:hypothetical protein
VDLGIVILNYSRFRAVAGMYICLSILVSTTNSAGASATFTFAGVAVQIFGTAGPNNAPYSVQLDEGSSSPFNSTKYAAYQQVLLYYADNLGPGSHNVTIVNQPALSGQSLAIDYAVVDTVPSVPTRYFTHL